MLSPATQAQQARAICRAAVIWIDWYAYHLARFKGLQSAIGGNGEVRGIELVGGVGVHKGYSFRAGMPQGLPVETLRPRDSWHGTGKLALSITLVRRLSAMNPAVVLIPHQRADDRDDSDGSCAKRLARGSEVEADPFPLRLGRHGRHSA